LVQSGAFRAAREWNVGHLGRYIANGPGMFEIDSSLQKRFHVSERLSLNFRAAAYNLLMSRCSPTIVEASERCTGILRQSAEAFGRVNSDHQYGRSRPGAPRRFEFMFRAEF